MRSWKYEDEKVIMMQNQWCTFLRDAGANIDNGIVTDFGNPDEEIQSAVNDNVIIDLSHFAIIKVPPGPKIWPS